MSLTLPRRSSYDPGVDPVRWPDVASLPPGGYRAKAARVLFERVARRMELQILLPDGTNIGAGGAGTPMMRLVRPPALYRRLGNGGLIGFGEAYLAGDWTADDLTAVLTVFCRRMATLVPPALQRLRDVAVHRHPHTERGTAENARRNISRHYDLSNDLFALFLDETLTYSAALFGPGDGSDAAAATATWDDLADAQRRKVDRLLDAAGVRAGSRVLEIGTGWGELALRAAARGATIRSITLSEEQRSLALQRVAAAGLSDRVSIELCDYRAAQGQYDAAVSVEMIEAVGYDFWPDYFATLHRLVTPGGRIGLQAITMPHDRMLASRDTYTWIHKYVFPGGLIPSVESVEFSAEQAGLTVTDRHGFGRHYAETLRLWRERFAARATEVEALGFDATFRRMWEFYLGYSEAGFRAEYLDVHQFVLTRGEG
ncbi:SAM-dependent methyltransferase [Sporichthya polymorpha]|uniref:SAM-dependent methyltransferase n=1 Tax=Sporichthya polymorpha TaxID=35751 RepID=UPI000371BAA0|nr:cyclopropane-fatty-acyl-phospholipid synthase family protein [Sporichthya polymorpha]